jgi:carboxyl-terminal processing protease
MNKKLAALPVLLAMLACSLGRAVVASPAPAATEAAPISTESEVAEMVPTPAYIPPACEGVALATVEPEVRLNPTATPAPNVPLTTEAQLGVLRGLENAVLDQYLYRDFGGLDWSAAVAEVRSRVEAGMETEAFYQELQDLIKRLGDDHSYFQTPAEFAAEQATLQGQLNFVGIGMLFLPRVERGVGTILAVFPDSPADHGGLRSHDSILRVDGIATVEGGMPQQQLLRGPACSQVVLTVQTPGEPARQVSFVRAALTGALPIDARLVPTADGTRVGYIFLPTFLDESIPDRVEQALQEFGPLDGLILDDRMNGGGLGSVAEAMLAFFSAGPMGYFVDSQGENLLNIDPSPVHNSQTVPIVVLIGEDTVSYGEIFAGVLQDIGRARLVGQTTLGNVEQLHRFDFSDGSRAWLATDRFDPLNSAPSWEENGVIPGVIVAGAWEDFTAEDDPAVAAALEVLAEP